MIVERYSKGLEARWNELVAASKNGTFLFDRRFMDYHSDRFCDCSLVFWLDEKRTQMIAALPANWQADEKTVYSHQGLTYGGFILSPQVTATQVLEMMDQACEYFAGELGACRLVYKPVPYIYSRYPAEEPLYALFRHDAKLIGRGLSSAVLLSDPLPLVQLRRRCANKALHHHLAITSATNDAELEVFWSALDRALQQRHHVHPVHTVAEMRLLMDRFPDNIQLYVAHTDEGQLMAGVWLFRCGPVSHLQYITTTDEGRECGALDLLIITLMEQLRPHHLYLDFGISTEDSGNVLNEGLIHQKQGFGARGVCYDTWEVCLSSTKTATS